MKNKEKYLIPGTIWETVIGHDTGTVIIRDVSDAEVICNQIYNRFTPQEGIEAATTRFPKDEFLTTFTPECETANNDTIIAAFENFNKLVDENTPHEKGLGIFKLNNKGDVISTKVLGEFTASPKAESAHFDMVDSAIDALENTGKSTNYLKMDGEKAQFETGAIRYTKTGKGRYDLIPDNVISDVFGNAMDLLREQHVLSVTKANIIDAAYRGDPYDRFTDTIINLVAYHYAPADIVQDKDGLTAHEVTIVSFTEGMPSMLKDLAIHYENGAEKYGVDNWKKGIPVTGGDRGGSFMDSAMRHLAQYLAGLTDEPHQISCIWNCVCGLYTLHQEQMKNKEE